MRSADRVLILKVKPGEDAKDQRGLVDKRLFTGEVKLHAIMDPQTCIWFMKYDKGGVPEALKQRFTTFSKLLSYAKEYFDSRNIDIIEVID